ncbi:MAG: SAM-dependent methyltransferase [Myxococcaceae bacterium]|nr:SAM-dependent methyltransferase [Myxococcaceae bacterium]
MRANETSRTAAWVAAGRALATARRAPEACRDPYAITMLSAPLRQAVEARVDGVWPNRPGPFARAALVDVTAKMMGPRTAAIDAHLTASRGMKQVVILGAGLDLRAHRLEALREAVVFEVDHPATQADKQARVAATPHLTRALVYVPVDFEAPGVEGSPLDAALERAGHRSGAPTTWLMEGVITYLDAADINRTLEVIHRRSSPASRLIATYNAPSAIRLGMRALTAFSREPHRTTYQPDEMRRLLATYGFSVIDDTGGLERAARFGQRPGLIELVWTRGHHVVAAQRAGSPA